jgi:cell wall-associated NlpC family hydrolase
VWKSLQKISNDQIEAGDLLFWPRTGPPGHVGIATSGTKVVHSPRPGKKVENVPITQAYTNGAAPVAYRYVGA